MTVQVPATAGSLFGAAGTKSLLYVVQGELTVSGEHAMEFHLLDMNDDGDAIACRPSRMRSPLRHAAPLGRARGLAGAFV